MEQLTSIVYISSKLLLTTGAQNFFIIVLIDIFVSLNDNCCPNMIVAHYEHLKDQFMLVFDIQYYKWYHAPKCK